MQVIDQLTLKLSRNITIGLKLDSYFTVTEKIVKEIMLKLYTMINHHDVFFSFVRNIVFFQKYLKRILIDLFLKTAA